MHVLKAVPNEKGGRGIEGGIAAYAKAIGRPRPNVVLMRQGAEVLESAKGVQHCTDLLDKVWCLAAIHALPAACWPAMVAALVKGEWSAALNRMEGRA